jgi:hypothetical protein
LCETRFAKGFGINHHPREKVATPQGKVSRIAAAGSIISMHSGPPAFGMPLINLKAYSSLSGANREIASGKLPAMIWSSS